MGQSGRVRRGGLGARAGPVGGRWRAGGVPAGAVALTARLSPLQSRHQKRARAQAQLRNLEAYAAQPHSFVFARGRAGRGVRQLSLDLRRVMEPLTATRLQVCTSHPASISFWPRLRRYGGGSKPQNRASLQSPWQEKGTFMGTIVPASSDFVGQLRGGTDEPALAGCLRLVVKKGLELAKLEWKLGFSQRPGES